MKDDERWLTDGHCGYCRRQEYCKKPCKAQKMRKQAILSLMEESRRKRGEKHGGIKAD